MYVNVTCNMSVGPADSEEHMDNGTMKVRVFRGLNGGEYVEYEIPFQDRMTVLNALNHVYEHFDRSLSFYVSCRIGKCKGCLVDVDGNPKLACTTPVKDGMRIGPVKKSQIIKDLLVDMSSHENKET
jgi:fumarate reductase iron-sulfur subunit